MRSRRAERLAGALTKLASLAMLRFVGCDPGASDRSAPSDPPPAVEGATSQPEPARDGASAAPREDARAVPATGDTIPAQLDRSPSACPDGMVRVEGGTLSTLERGPAVSVASFCLDADEVTVASYRACVREGRCDRACAPGARCPEVPDRTDWRLEGEDDKVSRFCNGGRAGSDEHPLNCVSFEEAMGYCAAHGKRLPSGDEWEWAAKGGVSPRPSPWGTAVATDEICWGKPRKRAGTCAQGSHPKDTTPEGAHALGGSVSEWVTPPARAKGGKAAGSGARWAYGASWYAIDDGYARAALGGVQMPARRAETVGFRCAK